MRVHYLVMAFYVLVLVALLSLIFFLMLYEWSLVVTRAPFIPIPQAVLPYVVDALELKPGSVVYDLGCGEGRVLLACWKRFPHARYVGLDKAVLAIWLARWRKRQTARDADSVFKRMNFFRQDLSDATHVFTYLFPGLMQRLLPKLKRELKPGARLVSCDFQFNDMKPVKTIQLDRPIGALGRTLYVYEF